MNKIIEQEIRIKSNTQDIFAQLKLWGESLWWPEDSLMKFTNLTGQINKNTVYLQEVRLPFAPYWHSRVDILDDKILFIKRVFIDGIFEGFEELKIIDTDNGYKRVNYKFYYSKVRGVINQIFWLLAFKNLHIKNIDNILKSLKKYLEIK